MYEIRRDYKIISGISSVPTPAPSNWTPAQLSGLKAWYKADAGVYNDAGITPATNGQTVQQWNDQSGNGLNILQASTSSRPTFLSTGMNGHQTLQFSAATVSSLVNSAFPLGSGNIASVFIVVNVSVSTPTFARIISYGTAATQRDFLGAGSPITDLFTFDGSASAHNTIATAANLRVGTIWDGANMTVYVNNSGGTPAGYATSFTDNQQMSVGCAVSGANPFDGNISEVVITLSAIGAADRNSLDSYFTSKYGI